jgi:receptor expression-enhancing protein 1/2/3/4
VEPYLVQNESDIDVSITSARYETLQFVQSRFSALWDIVYGLLSKTPVASSYSPSSNGTTANGSSSPLLNQGALLQSVQGLLGAIGAPSSWAAPAPPTGKPAISRSTTDTRSAENQAPFPAVPAGGPSTAGYDVDETQ